MKTAIPVKYSFPDLKSGSIVLETAIFFPVVLFVFVCLISKINCISSEFTLYEIIDETSRKASVRNIFVRYINDLIEHETSDMNEKELIEELSDLTNFSMTAISCNIEIAKEAKKNDVFRNTISIKNVYAEKSITGGAAYLICDYELKTPLSRTDKSYVIPVTLWESRRTLPAADKESEDPDIWKRDNFERGVFFRKRFGGNLPLGYPVIAGFSNGCALSIRSIDLNKKSWDDPDDVCCELEDEIDDLTAFKGTELPWGSDKIYIREKDIKTRIMKIVIPGDFNKDKYAKAIDEIKTYSEENSVQIVFIEYG